MKINPKIFSNYSWIYYQKFTQKSYRDINLYSGANS